MIIQPEKTFLKKLFVKNPQFFLSMYYHFLLWRNFPAVNLGGAFEKEDFLSYPHNKKTLRRSKGEIFEALLKVGSVWTFQKIGEIFQDKKVRKSSSVLFSMNFPPSRSNISPREEKFCLIFYSFSSDKWFLDLSIFPKQSLFFNRPRHMCLVVACRLLHRFISRYNFLANIL